LTELRAGKVDFCFRQQQRIFSSSRTSRPTQLLNGPRNIFKKESGRSVSLTTCLNLVTKLGMNGGIFLLPMHAFAGWTGRNLPFLTQTKHKYGNNDGT